MQSILSKIIELVMAKCLNEQTPRRRTGKKFLRLFTDLERCNEAYTSYNNNPCISAHIVWKDNVRALLHSFSHVALSLKIYDTELHDLSNAYCEIESYMGGGEEPLTFLTCLIGIDCGDAAPRSTKIIEEFDTLLAKMREFIKRNFSIEDFV